MNEDTALMALHLLCEGSSVRSVSRVTGHFQATSDAFAAYLEAVHYHLGTRTDYATLEKQFGYDEEQDRRYSPPEQTGVVVTPRHGEPDPGRIGTSRPWSMRELMEAANV